MRNHRNLGPVQAFRSIQQYIAYAGIGTSGPILAYTIPIHFCVIFRLLYAPLLILAMQITNLQVSVCTHGS
jgi:hypothetical protein